MQFTIHAKSDILIALLYCARLLASARHVRLLLCMRTRFACEPCEEFERVASQAADDKSHCHIFAFGLQYIISAPACLPALPPELPICLIRAVPYFTLLHFTCFMPHVC